MSKAGIRQALKSTAAFQLLWPAVRGLEQELKVRVDAWRYRMLARMKNIPAELSDHDLSARLSKRLQRRGAGAKRRGEIHTYYATPLAPWERHNIPAALELFGPLSHFYIKDTDLTEGHPDWIGQRDEFERRLLEDVRRAHAQRPIDVLVSYLSGRHIRAETIQTIKGLGIRTCAFWWDDGLWFRGVREAGRYAGALPLVRAYDLHLTSSSGSITKYMANGGLAAFWPEAANPNHYRPLDLPKTHDVSFIGARYGARPNWIRYLEKSGVQVAAFGEGWPRGSVTSDQIVEIYSSSKVVLGFGGIGYSMRVAHLKARDFEAPMCGAAYITSHHEDLRRVFRLGQEIETYRSKPELVASVRALLADPKRRERMRLAGRRRCLQEHTWEHRFQRAYELLGVLETTAPE